jgi:hypothetical protein
MNPGALLLCGEDYFFFFAFFFAFFLAAMVQLL